MRSLLVSLLVLQVSGEKGIDDKDKRPLDPLRLAATDTEMMWLREDGSYKMAYDAPNGFRAEVRDAAGGVKGVYGWTDQDGKLVTKTFLNDDKGFRYADFSDLGIELPQLPYNLHPVAGQRKFPKPVVEIEKDVAKSPVKSKVHPVQLYPFGRIHEDINAVVIEPAEPLPSQGRFIDRSDNSGEYTDYSDIVLIDSNSDASDYDGDVAVGALAGPPAQSHPVDSSQYQPQLQFPFHVRPGQNVAHIRPTATAIAGDNGQAQAGPAGHAAAGPGGIAVATPTGNAVVGGGGVAVSAPVASSQAGVGGIAIAGGHAIAIAGVENPETFLGTIGTQGNGDAQRPGWEALRRSSVNRQTQQQPMQIFPTIHNYFFNVPQSLFSQQNVNAGSRGKIYNPNFYSFR